MASASSLRRRVVVFLVDDQVSVFEGPFKPGKVEGVAKVHGPAPPAVA